MVTRSSVLVGTLILGSLCGCEQKPAPRSASPRASARRARPAPAKPMLLVNATELSNVAGWTPDGALVAIDRRDGALMEELGGDDQIELRDVYSTRTGQKVTSFRDERIKKPPDMPSHHDTDWKRARPKADWKRYEKRMRFLGGAAHRIEPRGRRRLEVRALERWTKPGKLTITHDRWGYHLELAGFKVREDPPRGQDTFGPRLRIAVTGPGRRGAMTLRMPLVKDWGAEGETSKYSAEIRSYWLPGSRVLILVRAEVEGFHEEHGEVRDAWAYLLPLR